MQVFVLLKGFSKNGLVTFHGMAMSQNEANAWDSGSATNWSYEVGTDDGSVTALRPISKAVMDGDEDA